MFFLVLLVAVALFLWVSLFMAWLRRNWRNFKSIARLKMFSRFIGTILVLRLTCLLQTTWKNVEKSSFNCSPGPHGLFLLFGNVPTLYLKMFCPNLTFSINDSDLKFYINDPDLKFSINDLDLKFSAEDSLLLQSKHWTKN